MKSFNPKKLFSNHFCILRNTAANFWDSRPIDLASSTAYFAIFSIAPILIIIISVFGYFAGDHAIRIKLFEELNVLIGQESTLMLQNAIDNYKISENSGIGTIIGLVFFLISATTLFNVMQSSINLLWHVRVKSNLKQNILKFIRDRILSFGVILTLGFLLLVSLIVDASIAFLKEFLTTNFSEGFVVLAQVANIALSLAIISGVFAVIYYFLPDVKVRWSAAWFGAMFTALLFSVGKVVIGMIVGKSNLGAVYGAASSFIGVLVWIYYASIIFYFGVELTRQFSIFYHHENTPLNYAERSNDFQHITSHSRPQKSQ